jgi:hypothetical protein
MRQGNDMVSPATAMLNLNRANDQVNAACGSGPDVLAKRSATTGSGQQRHGVAVAFLLRWRTLLTGHDKNQSQSRNRRFLKIENGRPVFRNWGMDGA